LGADPVERFDSAPHSVADHPVVLDPLKGVNVLDHLVAVDGLDAQPQRGPNVSGAGSSFMDQAKIDSSSRQSASGMQE
jgi:hypothetical protein